jgi:hypothetical protein
MRLFCLLLALALLPVHASSQSLGAAARKEEERRQKNKEKGVQAPLFDDSKIAKKGGAVAAPAASPAPTPRATAESSQASTADADGEQRRRQEEMWRGRMTAARGRRDEARKSYDYLSSQSLGPMEYFVDDRGKVLIRDVEHLRELIAQAKAEWDAAEQAIVELEDAARRAGALPGWLR